MKQLSKIASGLSGLLIAVLVVITAVSVVARYLLGAPLQWTEEMSGLLMIWIVMVAAIACERENEHLTIEFLVRALPRRPRLLTEGVVALASTALLVCMGWLAWELAASAQFRRTQILGVSWFWINFAVVIGAAGIAVVTLLRLFRGDEPFYEGPKV